MKKLEYGDDERINTLKTRLEDLEKRVEATPTGELNEEKIKEFEELWKRLINDNQRFVDERLQFAETQISKSINGAIANWNLKAEMEAATKDLEKLYKMPVDHKLPQLTESDLGHKTLNEPFMNAVCSKSIVDEINCRCDEAFGRWKLQFDGWKDQEFSASKLEQFLREVGELLGIQHNANTVPYEPEKLQQRSRFKMNYISEFVKFACHYAYTRSLENSESFISLTDPLGHINERYRKSIDHCKQITTEAKARAVSKQVFNYAKRSFVGNLGRLITADVCNDDHGNSTFKTKRTFLNAILLDLGERTHSLSYATEGEKKRIFEEFMLYMKLADSEESEEFFLSAILKILKEMMTKKTENTSQSDFEKMIENNVGQVIERVKSALREAEAKSNGHAAEYIRIFKDCMNVTSQLDFRIRDLNGFTEAVLGKIDTLYADFLGTANSSFENLMCKENKAAIHSMLEKIMGCREKCPFCSAPCSQSLQEHVGDHRANHYPLAVSGTVECSYLFTKLQETHGVSVARGEKKQKRGTLVLSICQTMAGSDVGIRTFESVKKFDTWFSRLFNWNYIPFKKYREMEEYKCWDIPYCRGTETSLYWKWFVAQFHKELAEHYKAVCPEIPQAWVDITWEEAKRVLDEQGLTSFLKERIPMCRTAPTCFRPYFRS